MATQLDMLHQPYFATMGPLIVITITAFVVMILEFIVRRGDKRWLAGISMLGVAVALVVALLQFSAPQVLALNTMIADAFGNLFSILLLISALLILLFTIDYSGKRRVAAEHTYLILFGLAGALAMSTAIDLVTLYVGLELLSISSYVLVAVRKRSVRAVEGGAKYLIMGSIGSAVLLYGMSFIYGIGGTTNLDTLGQNGMTLWQQYPAVVVMAFLLMLAGMGVKLSLVPFHMWTPDAYEGAPAPVSSFLATLSKTAAFGMLVRMMLYIFNASAPHIFYWAAILAAVTMVVGNFIALPQRNMKRLLAFSSVAQAGYVLVPFALLGAVDPAGSTAQLSDWASVFTSLLFYLFAYTFMTIGAFAVVHVVSHATRTVDDEALVGLWKRSPWLAIVLTIFVMSLAGAPLTGGFIGKFYIFTDTIHLKEAWLGIILFGTSVVSFFYYFGWLRKVFRSDVVVAALEHGGAAGDGGGSGDGGAAPGSAGRAATAAVVLPKIRVSAAMNALLGVCAAATLVLGFVPASLLHALLEAKWF
ncbi:NADH-quinone oxidoreductase subunit N [Alicyclobacillus cycloheptanicus]|uniref:NADH-quinone oxidoreductase subunit N n=1 Tax=Alicyclobacillus cycloheptanicus TaxID=1457 RepID=A0ABT9XGU4_9BACL|nr:NADH-quinone oxidoreductase subunit N [Alicyclobacillus cycloheptanicus]MDQ0189407.1 NADH-quinone oxidoreductase subunit N [Alicyclobacillus cycloheptanicus]WDM02281.1 NADH-quinone oxidoreductase subunit N [Alicyclobacillus cycloheptanicus]